MEGSVTKGEKDERRSKRGEGKEKKEINKGKTMKKKKKICPLVQEV